jgi:hypothetical protein
LSARYREAPKTANNPTKNINPVSAQRITSGEFI